MGIEEGLERGFGGRCWYRTCLGSFGSFGSFGSVSSFGSFGSFGRFGRIHSIPRKQLPTLLQPPLHLVTMFRRRNNRRFLCKIRIVIVNDSIDHPFQLVTQLVQGYPVPFAEQSLDGGFVGGEG